MVAEHDGLDRRSFLKRTAAAMVGFVATGWALARPGDARAASFGCDPGRVYCKLVEYVPPNMCFYNCYDSVTLEYCYGFCEDC